MTRAAMVVGRRGASLQRQWSTTERPRGTRFRRRGVTAAVGASVALGLAACEPGRRSEGPATSATGQATSEQSGTPGRPITLLDTIISAGSASLDPAVATTALLKYGMSETLTRVNRKGELEPWLAASWRSLDPLRWEIRLRESVTFWDGTPVDAAAVKASLERSVGKNADARARWSGAAAEVGDPRTLIIRTQEPNGLLPLALSYGSFAIHNVRAAEAMGDDAFAQRPVLTGPFKTTDYKPGESLTLSRHDAHRGGRPYLSGFVVKYAQDPNARVLALQSGDADVIFDPPTQSLRTLRAHPGIRLAEHLSDTQYFLLLNQRTPPLDDARVCRAVGFYVDRRALVEQVLEGAHDVATDVFSPVYSWALKNAYPTDATRGDRLLSEAGWQRGADGLWRKDGRPLSFTLTHYAGRPDLQPLGIAIQAQLRKAGITADLKQVEQPTAAIRAPDWGGAMWFTTTAMGGDPLYLPATYMRPEGGQYMGYGHAEIPQLIERMQTSIEQSKRLETVRRFQDLMVEEAPMIPLVVVKLRLGLGERLKNVQAHMLNWVLVEDGNFGK